MQGFFLKNLGAILCAAGMVVSAGSPARADSCVTAACHKGIADIPKPHAPVKDGDCSACHKQKEQVHPLPGGKSFELTAKGAALCTQCHDPFGKKKVVHPPVQDGDCTACHRPHGAAGRFLLDVSDDQAALCLGCHDSAPFKQKFMHGPVAVGACTKCHDPHEAAQKGLLKGTVRELCLKCHVDFAKTLKESPVVHPPVRDDPCTDCHSPHGSPFTVVLKKKMPDLCVECHIDLGEKLAAVKVPHKPLLQEGVCGNCHSTHFSKSKGLLPTDQKSLCLNCHGTDNLGKPPLKNIKKELAGKKYVHGPIQKGSCKACHDPHGSNYFRMLTGNYPDTLYAPYKEGAYDFCLQCHEKNLLRFAETTVYTKFRNGGRNLHFVHVANRQKGRTCRICHAPHASDGEKLINKDGAQFGEWKIPINFKITATGGSCAPGCHRAFKYDREKPVEYRPEDKP